MWRRHLKLFCCLVLSALLHLVILASSASKVADKQPYENIFVTLTPQESGKDLHDDVDKSPVISEEILAEVKRMINRKLNATETSSASVFKLCEDEKIIMGIGVKLSFGTNTVISAPDYLPAFIGGIREGDVIENMIATDLVAEVLVKRNAGNILFNIPVINLCNVVKKDF